MKLILIILSVFTIKACGTMSSKNKLNQETITPDGSFLVNMLQGEDLENFNLTITFNSEKKNISGYSGCNNYTGSYTFENNNLNIGPLASTKKMCIDEKDNTTEYKFLNSLSEIDEYSLKENNLKLLSQGRTLIEASINNNMTFEYVALSRGFYKKITISKDLISVSKKRDSNTIEKNYPIANWDSLLLTSEKINLPNLSVLKPPSKDHQFDGAPLARLTISTHGSTYETQSFDHGNPPKAIESLVKEILSIAENVE